MLTNPGGEADRVIAENKARAFRDGTDVGFSDLPLTRRAMNILSIWRENYPPSLAIELPAGNMEIEVRKNFRNAFSVEENYFCLYIRHREEQPHYTLLVLPLPAPINFRGHTP